MFTVLLELLRGISPFIESYEKTSKFLYSKLEYDKPYPKGQRTEDKVLGDL
jgi:hypothetical protein